MSNKIIIVNLLLIFSFCSYAAEDKLRLITCECQPLSYTLNDKAAGPAVDIVKGIQKKLDTNEKIEIHPWVNGYVMMFENSNVVLFTMARTEHREKLFKWVGPIVKKDISFHVKKGSQIKINSIEDAKKYRIGVILGSNHEHYLISNGFKRIYSVTEEKLNLKNLIFNKIDLWYTDTSQSSSLEEMVLNRELLEEAYTVETRMYYYAFNKKISNKVIKSWQNAFNELREEGTVLKILAKYNLQSLYPH